MRALSYIFSFHGRLTAANYWRHQWATAAVTFPVLIGVTMALSHWLPDWALVVGFGSAIFVQTTAYASALVRRLHDLGLSGWFGLCYPAVTALLLALFFGPVTLPAPLDQNFLFIFFGIVLTLSLASLLLYILPGQRGANRFGPDPRAGNSPAPTTAQF